MVSKTTLKNSAKIKGMTPNSIIGLSHPISVPNHRTPRKYIVETDKISFKKIKK